MDRSDLLEHLRFAGELGIGGMRPGEDWRRPVRDAAASLESTRRPVAGLDAEFGHETTEESERSKMGAGQEEGTGADRAARLLQLRATIGYCTRCKLHTLGRRQVVFGSGHPEARLMFVGEAPGADEDMQGVPFVGRAGQLLTKIIESIGLTRDQVYIANVIKCRPPQNRNPEADEVQTCQPFLFGQVDIIAPKVIVALGTFAAQALLATAEPISRLRGRTFDYRGAVLVPTFHPAYLLRNPASKRDVWEDMKRVRTLLS